MAIRNVFDWLGRALEAKLGAVVQIQGPNQAGDFGSVPRLGWLPMEGMVDAPKGVAGAGRTQGDAFKRRWAIQVEIVHADFDELAELVDLALGLMREGFSHESFPPGIHEVWKVGGNNAEGSKYTATWFVVAPVVRVPLRVVNPASAVLKTGLAGSAETGTDNDSSTEATEDP